MTSMEDTDVTLDEFSKEVLSSSDSLCKKWKPTKLGLEVSQQAFRCSQNFVKSSVNYSAKYEKVLPKLAASELEIGSLLGSGGFSDVYEITSFHLIDNSNEDKDQWQSRLFLKRHEYRERTGDCRFAVKFLKDRITYDKKAYALAAMDIATEAKILCSVLHPNIIKLRGLCSAGEMGFSAGRSDGFFLILDRLYDTLEQRIAKWKLEEKNFDRFKVKKYFDANKRKLKDIQNDRIRISLDIVAALKYLHKRNIVYRDLKPENLGFDVRGDIKLFDFGLAKEITSSHRMALDGTYKLTGAVGSLRYMAPEVAKRQRYNLSADVYSFCVMFWEILTLKKPYQDLSRDKHSELVVYGDHRPKISKSIPLKIQNLLQEGWSSKLGTRPDFDDIFTILFELLSTQTDVTPRPNYTQRRSTYVNLSDSVAATLQTRTRTLCIETA